MWKNFPKAAVCAWAVFRYDSRGETNGVLLQFSRGAPSTPPLGFLFPQVKASLRLGYSKGCPKTAANRRLFAGRRFWCNNSPFVCRATSTRLRNDVSAAANRSLLIAMRRIGTLDGRLGGFACRFGDRVASCVDGRGFTHCPSDRAFYAWFPAIECSLARSWQPDSLMGGLAAVFLCGRCRAGSPVIVTSCCQVSLIVGDGCRLRRQNVLFGLLCDCWLRIV